MNKLVTIKVRLFNLLNKKNKKIKRVHVAKDNLTFLVEKTYNSKGQLKKQAVVGWYNGYPYANDIRDFYGKLSFKGKRGRINGIV